MRADKFLTDNKVICGGCKKELYEFTGKVVIGKPIYASDFKPLGDIPAPKDGEAVKCPLCGAGYNDYEDEWYK